MNPFRNPSLSTLVRPQPIIPCSSHPPLPIPQIGNLCFYTTEEQIHVMFLTCANPEDGGGVKYIMGLDRHTRMPCGACFVEFYTHTEARIIRCDLDFGYRHGKQFGRGKSGGQVRDEQDYDPGRGRWDAQEQKIEIERRRQVEVRYADAEQSSLVAMGGESTHKRARSPYDEDDGSRQCA